MMFPEYGEDFPLPFACHFGLGLFAPTGKTSIESQ